MSNIYKASFLGLVCFILLSAGTVAFAYQNPTANAGPDLYVGSGQTITLQGSGYDPQGSNLTYYWNCSGGTLSNSAIAQPTYISPSNSIQSYTCSLTVTNTYSLSNSDSMTVYINNSNNNNNNNVAFSVQTNPATNIQNNQADLNGYFYGNNSYLTYVWFQYGTSTNYSDETPQQSFGSATSYDRTVAGLSPNTTYHFRAVGLNVNGNIYGQDMTFSTGNNGNNSNYYGNGTLTNQKQVINLSSGNLNWQSSVSAKPGDILSFAITMQADGQDIHNVFIQDILPADLIYRGNLTVNAGLNYSGNPASGINISTIPAGGVEIISYQAQVAPSSNFTYGTTTLNNNATITSTEAGTQTVSATTIVNNQIVYSAATTVSTGLTNNPITDSFFLPIFLIILGSWFYFSGNVYKFSDWLGRYI